MYIDREDFVDRVGKTVREGSILRYDEGPNGYQSIEEVVRYRGQLCGRSLLVRLEGKWIKASSNEEPIKLVFYMLTPDSSDGKLIDAVVIYVDREFASDPRNGPVMWGNGN